ncbi:hypothetical protein [Niveispirillum sp. BGYR6]|uniref:helix-turn-helix transcriptional regulator n=1 Tax=Niveispirillum sp. BGYR6 TaxID=2971249 RepID=UPI0022B96032|nr:hypothetical protein [Niveispirillum sp. BGYR6]MDG5495176.1 hypothetical protein [Niveispirillum sp. BGYR6]
MQEMLLNIYACPSAPDRWSTVLDQVCDFMSVRSAVIQVLDYRGGRFTPVWDVRDSYSHAHRQEHDRVLNNGDNPRLRICPSERVARQPVVTRDEDVFPPGSPELLELKQRRQMLQLGCNLCGLTELSPGRFLVLVLHRSVMMDQPFGRAEEDLTMQLLPHLRQAIDLGDQLQSTRLQADLLAEAGEVLGAALVLCDTGGRIIWMNNPARTILHRSPAVREMGGYIRAVQPADAGSLRTLLSQAGAGGPVQSTQLTLGRMDGEGGVQVMATGLQAGPMLWGRETSRTVALVLREPGRPMNISPAAVAALFGMSTAEARLTVGLCDGLSLRDYAQQRGITEGTARIQLKRALAKTGCPRQAELVRRVCTSLAVSMMQ